MRNRFIYFSKELPDHILLRQGVWYWILVIDGLWYLLASMNLDRLLFLSMHIVLPRYSVQILWFFFFQAVQWVIVGREHYWLSVVNSCFKHLVFRSVFFFPSCPENKSGAVQFDGFVYIVLHVYLGQTLSRPTCFYFSLFWACSIPTRFCSPRGICSDTVATPFHLWPSVIGPYKLSRNPDQRYLFEVFYALCSKQPV